MAEENSAEKIARLEREIETLKKENERLRGLLEEALRAAKRQAAPFSRRHPKACPQKPGRKPGRKYGRRCRRPVPRTIDEVVEALLPTKCPHCGGGLEEGEVVSQYQTEIPVPQVVRIEFRIHVGRCRKCRRRVQARHPRQTSDAIGGAASQLGPRALGLATQLNKGLGLPYGKTAAALEQAFGLRVSRAGLCQAMARVARKAEPTYDALIEQIRGSPSVTPDETGWRVGGRLWWMWAFSSSQVTVYAIQPGRGFKQAAEVLGPDFDGFLVRDGWSIYRQFVRATHQSCLAHLLRRCREMILQSGRAGVSPRRASHSAASSATAGPLPARSDQPAGSGHCSRTTGNTAGRHARASLAFAPKPAVGESSVTRARGSVHVSQLSWSGGHQLAGRTGHPPHGGHAQGLGRQPHHPRSPNAKRPG